METLVSRGTRRHLGFNRTDTEWKPFFSCGHFLALLIQSNRYGMETYIIVGVFAPRQDSIEPIRNGNIPRAPLGNRHTRFNRTDTEWKRGLISEFSLFWIQSNRYGMETGAYPTGELIHLDSIEPIRNGNDHPYAVFKVPFRFNRTDTEWKPEWNPSSFNMSVDSIEPIRNGNCHFSRPPLFFTDSIEPIRNGNL